MEEFCDTCHYYEKEYDWCDIKKETIKNAETTWCYHYKPVGLLALPIFEQNAKDFTSITVGGCTTHDHGTSLYKRCKNLLEDKKTKGVRVCFTKHDHPIQAFWYSFFEKLYKQYSSVELKQKICFRGVTENMRMDIKICKEIAARSKQSKDNIKK
jgi:hypothetical protein